MLLLSDALENKNRNMDLELNEANGRGYEIPELQTTLVYAKAMEISEHAREAVNCFDLP